MERKYTLKQKHDNRGYYAEITFEVSLINNNGSGIKIEYLADQKWESICKAGILLFHDYFTRSNAGDLKVLIHDIKWMTVDTNNLIVMYACVAALSEALDFPIKGLSFDLDNKIFSFPDRRNV